MIQVAVAIETLNPTKAALWFLIIISFGSTVFSLSWDYYMDWGLFRSQSPGRRYLRPKLLYPVWFYYFAMASNLVMRFAWVLGVLSFPQWVDQSQLIVLVQCLVEGCRRAQWALIRIENENVNNFERYRTILQIPAFKEDSDDEGKKDE